MPLKDAVFFVGIFASICAVALAAVLFADRLPAAKAEPSCRWVTTEVIPASFQVYNNVRFDLAAYEVDVLMCDGGTITVRR